MCDDLSNDTTFNDLDLVSGGKPRHIVFAEMRRAVCRRQLIEFLVTRATLCVSAVFAVEVCLDSWLDVCPSHAGIVCKRLKVNVKVKVHTLMI